MNERCASTAVRSTSIAGSRPAAALRGASCRRDRAAATDLGHLAADWPRRDGGESLDAGRPRAVRGIRPRLYMLADGACSLYAGDAAYDSGTVDAPGPRHRLWMLESGWRYERSDIAAAALVTERGRTSR